jgi:hypothetical protein
MCFFRVVSVACLTIATTALMCGSGDAQTTAGDIVLHTSTVSPLDVHGDWARTISSDAASGAYLTNPDRSRAKVAPALASPENYFEMRFNAQGATAYHLWIRMRAADDSTDNDSVFVQFSDSVNSLNQAVTRIGTTSAAGVVLQNGQGAAAPSGWGWADNGWGWLGAPIYFEDDGTHVIRIQQRDDGAAIDQIVLSPTTFATTAPGDQQEDATILPAAGGIGPPVSTDTVVIRPPTAAAGRMYGSWQIVSDALAAGGQALRNPDEGASKITPALSYPASYFEASFNASAGRAYHLWLRVRADGNVLTNDSIHVQFSDSLTSSGSPVARIGTTSSFEPGLMDGPYATFVQNWGWTDNGWGSLGSHIYFETTGSHTIRIQQREDGPRIDQIVISPDTYLTSSPGWRLEDRTILSGTATSPPPPPSNQPPSVSLTEPSSGDTFAAPASIMLTATASDPENRLARVEFFSGATRLATDTTAPYSYTWSGVAAGSYQLRAVAFDADGGSATSSTATVSVGSSSSLLTRRVAFTASADHETVTRYVMDVYLSTGIIGVTLPLTTSDLGKPTPDSSNEIIVDQTSLLSGLLPGLYKITVSAVGPGGSSRSSPYSFTR